MNSPTRATTTPSNNLPVQLEQIGLHALATELNDFLARATKQRWSPRQILEHLAQNEAAERAHRSLERRLRLSEIKKFKPMADFNWSWPTKIERDVIERALTLDFLPEARNLILVGTNGLGKTMIAQNICHGAVLAGHSVLFRSAAALLEELHRQTPEGRHRKLRTYANVGLLCIDEVGYLSFDDKSGSNKPRRARTHPAPTLRGARSVFTDSRRDRSCFRRALRGEKAVTAALRKM
jgi:DNA replication protein DnaC